MNRAGEFLGPNALLFRSHNEVREDRNHRAVHGHRDGHFLQRDSREEDFHVLDGIDRNSRLAHIARDAGMIAVVTAMGGEIEGDRKAHLPAGEILAVERVRTPRPSRNRHIGEPSRAGPHTSWRVRRAGTARCLAGCRPPQSPPGRPPCRAASHRSLPAHAKRGCRAAGSSVPSPPARPRPWGLSQSSCRSFECDRPSVSQVRNSGQTGRCATRSRIWRTAIAP